MKTILKCVLIISSVCVICILKQGEYKVVDKDSDFIYIERNDGIYKFPNTKYSPNVGETITVYGDWDWNVQGLKVSNN